jgi:hypothetical protein
MSQHSDVAPGLNDNHLRRIYATCQHIDRLLKAIETALDPAGRRDPFHPFEHVLSQETRVGIREVLRRFRAAMASVLTRHQIPISSSDQDRFAIQSIVEFISTDVVELRPEHMGGYGELGERGRAELLEISDEFAGHLAALRWVLQRDPTGSSASETGHDGN